MAAPDRPTPPPSRGFLNDLFPVNPLEVAGGLYGLGTQAAGNAASYTASHSPLDFLAPGSATNPGVQSSADKFGGDITAMLDSPAHGHVTPSAAAIPIAAAGAKLLPEAKTAATVAETLARRAEPAVAAAPPITVYHGSPNADLQAVSASPPTRQFDNATSMLGAFFSPDSAGAQRYAGSGGKVYEANLGLKNPYEMPVSQFLYLQDITRGPRDADGFLGQKLPPESWGDRQEELKTEGAQLRQQLQDAGHDGLIIRDTKGNIKEISSFNDVPLSPPTGASVASSLYPQD